MYQVQNQGELEIFSCVPEKKVRKQWLQRIKYRKITVNAFYMVSDKNHILQYELLLCCKKVTFLLQLQSLKVKKGYLSV